MLAGSSAKKPSDWSRRSVSIVRTDCFSVGTFPRWFAATRRIPSSVAVSSLRSDPHLSTSPQNSGPALTTAIWACIPLSCRWSRRAPHSESRCSPVEMRPSQKVGDHSMSRFLSGLQHACFFAHSVTLLIPSGGLRRASCTALAAITSASAIAQAVYAFQEEFVSIWLAQLQALRLVQSLRSLARVESGPIWLPLSVPVEEVIVLRWGISTELAEECAQQKGAMSSWVLFDRHHHSVHASAVETQDGRETLGKPTWPGK